MGYYGLGPGTQIADNLTDFEKDLRAIPLDISEKSLSVLESLCRNTAQYPAEEKYRKIRLSNAKIHEAITSVDAALQALLDCGWVLDDEDTLILPKIVNMTFPVHVTQILEAKQWAKKEQGNIRAANGLSRIPIKKDKAVKSAFDFEDRRVKEEMQSQANTNLQKLRQEQRVRYEQRNSPQGSNRAMVNSAPVSINTSSATYSNQNPRNYAPSNGRSNNSSAGNNNGGFAMRAGSNSATQTELMPRGGNSNSYNGSPSSPRSPRDCDRSTSKSGTGASPSKPGQFASRAKLAAKEEGRKQDALDLRDLQKQKYKAAQASGRSVAKNIGKGSGASSSSCRDKNDDETVWYNPSTWFGGGGDDKKPPPGAGGRGGAGGARIRTVGDLPKPVRR